MGWKWWKRYWGLQGHIDVLDRYHVTGWAADRNGVAPELSIQVGGQIIGRIVPSYARADLRRRFGDRCNVGFDYAFEDPVAAGATVSIADVHGRTLPNSPLVVPAEAEQIVSDTIDGLSTPVPEPHLIFLVAGHRDRFKFARTRRPPVDYMIARLIEAGVDHATFDAILDFGCGCGRILSGWEGRFAPQTRLLGCDINPKLIAFCAANIPFAESFTSDYLPPLANIQAAQIDFLYAASVFTHLTESAARQWASEMRRIVKPGGIVMISFHGAAFRNALANLSENGARELDTHGFYCYVYGTPEHSRLGSNEYAAFMTPNFVIGLFQGFEPVRMIQSTDESNPFSAAQDVAIFRRSKND